ncbi:MAG TPA: 3-phosphoserine/phosphohydroxythreonine transaminase [Clostridia bacterium]|nr:3-phosphoserine/phosphohydroxythreonine transaminase [Clostridia bacterium]
MRVYNFAAGPSMLPLEVLEEAQKSLIDYNNSGMSIMECTHRGKVYEPVHSECISLVKELMGISDEYEVLLLQGGASTQFDAIPLNLMKTGKADYVVTGNFAGKAYKEAKKYGEARLAGSSEDKKFTYIPEQSQLTLSSDADYVHYTMNNTIYGSKWEYIPTSNAPIVCDMSSCIMSEVVDVNKFGLIYAGAQKNLGPAGVTLVIVRKDLIGNEMPICPTMLKYSIHAKDNSLYNTPPTFSIYMMMLNLRHSKALGGIAEIEKTNKAKAKLLYDFLDNSNFYINAVEKGSRSIMNVTFTTPNEELDAACVKGAAALGLVNLKGHRLVGGLRASIYNAMPLEGVKLLVEYLGKFELANK